MAYFCRFPKRFHLFQVKGVTARELCHFFFAPEFRMEWETTVEQATVLEKIAPDTLIFLQVWLDTLSLLMAIIFY